MMSSEKTRLERDLMRKRPCNRTKACALLRGLFLPTSRRSWFWGLGRRRRWSSTSRRLRRSPDRATSLAKPLSGAHARKDSNEDLSWRGSSAAIGLMIFMTALLRWRYRIRTGADRFGMRLSSLRPEDESFEQGV